MRLVQELERVAATDASPFRAQLAREDIQRLAALRSLAGEHETPEEFHKHGLFIGWTQGDLRTKELSDTLTPLMDALYEYERGGASEEREAAILEAWNAFHAHRLKVLVHCL